MSEGYINGKWRVTVGDNMKKWVWEYTFEPNGIVRWLDPLNNERGTGRWVRQPKTIFVSWAPTSKTKEFWNLTMTDNPTITGTYHADYGNFNLKAEKMMGNIILEPLKPLVVPNAVDHRIFFPPPPFRQRDLYLGEEGLFACWCTSAEMIVKWRNQGAPFKRPSFLDLIPNSGDVLGVLAYMDFVNKFLIDHNFIVIPNYQVLELDTITLATMLHQYGPIYCEGSFGGLPLLSIGGSKHVIALFGAQDEQVYYRDPSDGFVKTMATKSFELRLLKIGAKSMRAYGPNSRGRPEGPKRWL